MRTALALAVAALASCSSPALADPFTDLSVAYANRNALAAAASYARDAVVTYRYEGTPEERHSGTRAIASSFRTLFDQIDAKDRLDLNFRETLRAGNRVHGYYRLRIGRRQVSYGQFHVMLDNSGKFASDVSSGATRDDFEEAAGKVMVAPADETLDRDFYARLAGRYRFAAGCTLIVTRSVVRLFARDSCTGDWRGLSRQSGRHWTGGDRVLSDKKTTIYRFASIQGGVSPSVEIVDGNGVKVATRTATYETEDVTFKSADGTTLAGTLYRPPSGAKRRPATVMLHGSGPQDRDGYASIIAVLADELAAAGRVVLAFDKRGSGQSGGDGDRASFSMLAADGRAGMDFLASRSEVDRTRIGFAGSSQAGWVAAKAIADGASPADVFLLGAAGAALTVAEQNLYNTKIRMRCQGIGGDDIALALAQQRAFFDFLAGPTAAARLDALTAKGRLRPALNGWLFPDSRTTDRSAAAWYVVLDPSFDPLPVWKRYRGKAAFVFSQFDDSTPTPIAQARLQGVTTTDLKFLSQAQHLGLATDDLCKGELSDVTKFAPGLMPIVASFGMSAN